MADEKNGQAGEPVDQKTEYQKATTTEAKLALVESASSVAELDAMFAAWEERGVSREGQIAGAVLRRKEALGEISDDERARLAKIDAAVAHGRSLPPIGARMAGTEQEG